MEHLIFSLNATVPIFLLMLLGYLFKRIGWVTEDFALKLNNFVFRIAIPFMVFEDLATVDFNEAWDGPFVLFCFGATVLSILIASALSFFLRDKTRRGEFIQATYRSSAAVLGLAFIQNIYGTVGLGPLMIIGSVPLYNACAVMVLSIFSPENAGRKPDRALVKKTLIGVVTNPIIIGILLGLIWSALHLPTPDVFLNVVSRVGDCATPLGLIAMGGCFEFKKAMEAGRTAVLASAMKLIGFGLIFVPAAVALGYRNEELIAILVMLCSASTVSCFVMAKNMGHEGTLSSTTVMLTTLLSSFTLTAWLFALKSLGYV